MVVKKTHKSLLIMNDFKMILLLLSEIKTYGVVIADNNKNF